MPLSGTNTNSVIFEKVQRKAATFVNIMYGRIIQVFL